MSISHPPTVYVLAGPNGAGKTTFASRFLPGFVQCQEFLNADLIAAGLSPFNSESQNVRAGRLLLERMEELVAGRKSFGFETTLSGRAYQRRLRAMQAIGYRVELFYLWLPSVELAIDRVANRVRQGGHSVPEADIRRRYAAGLKNLMERYGQLADVWDILEATEFPPRRIATAWNGSLTILDEELYRRFLIAASA